MFACLHILRASQIPYMGTDTPSNTWPHFEAGAKCTFMGVTNMEMDPSAQCASLWWICCLWILANIAANVTGLAVCRKGSAVLYNVVNSVQLPILNLLYSSSFVMTAALATEFNDAMWVGLVVCCAGFIVYQFVPLQSPRCHVTNANDADVNSAGASTLQSPTDEPLVSATGVEWPRDDSVEAERIKQQN
jgi:hypothetical protein